MTIAKVHLRVGGRNAQALCGASLVVVQDDLFAGRTEIFASSTSFLLRTTCERCREWFRRGRAQRTRASRSSTRIN